MPPDTYSSSYSFLPEKTSHRIKQYARKPFRFYEFGITVDQWIILEKVYEHDNLYQRELAELTFKHNPTLTKIIDLLCKKELLNRAPDKHDRQRFRIVLTAKGMNKVEEMLPYVGMIR